MYCDVRRPYDDCSEQIYRLLCSDEVQGGACRGMYCASAYSYKLTTRYNSSQCISFISISFWVLASYHCHQCVFAVLVALPPSPSGSLHLVLGSAFLGSVIYHPRSWNRVPPSSKWSIADVRRKIFWSRAMPNTVFMYAFASQVHSQWLLIRLLIRLEWL